MSIAQSIQDAWQRQAKWLMLLRPLSYVYRAAFILNKYSYQSGFKKVYQAPVPVMVIGNITVGGSGKTPLLIALVKYLTKRGLRVAVISRGYGGAGPFPTLVGSDATPEQVGDEPCLIMQSTGVAMAVGPNRQASIELLLAEAEYDLVICDDGLQHWALYRQIEWIVLDSQRGLGNQRLLPEGYLREPASRLAFSTVIEHAQQPKQELHMHLEVGKPYLLNATEPMLDGVYQPQFDPDLNYYAVVGIGFPQRFYRTLEHIGVQRFQCHEFEDHHDYEISDIQFEDTLPIITTEKDAVKLKQLLVYYPEFKSQIWVLPVEAVLSDACYAKLDQQLAQLNIFLKG